jgi:hypothetical protein
MVWKLMKYEAPFWHSLWSPLVVTRREGVSSDKLHFEVSGIATWRVEMPHLLEMRNLYHTWIGHMMEDGGRS